MTTINRRLRHAINQVLVPYGIDDLQLEIDLTSAAKRSLIDLLPTEVEDEGTGVEQNRYGINDFVLRERNRGYEVIKNFDFEVAMDGSLVEISLNMKKIT